MTLRDLVELAAWTGRRAPTCARREVARLPDDRDAGELAELMRVELDSSYLELGDADDAFPGPPWRRVPAPRHRPRVRARAVRPGHRAAPARLPAPARRRQVTGEVPVPGSYTLRAKDERLADLVDRAGGLLETAYPNGARFFREDSDLDTELSRVAIDLPDALADIESGDNLTLQPGDSLHIPVYSPTVVVSRAPSNSPSTVLYREGEGLEVLHRERRRLPQRRRRGPDCRALRQRPARAPRFKFLFWSSYPSPGPGSRIAVPDRGPRRPLRLARPHHGSRGHHRIHHDRDRGDVAVGGTCIHARGIVGGPESRAPFEGSSRRRLMDQLITADPKIMMGKTVVTGTRISVECIVERVGALGEPCRHDLPKLTPVLPAKKRCWRRLRSLRRR
ncbi:MAG: SLBB domain-containing protein [Gemmatimonadota bacterium]|nr:SLBB domain-containing protein [Gemmatimonadota bacterium]